MTGTREIRTERLVLRPHVMEDAPALHRLFGVDESMFAYTGWNPFVTVEAAEEMLTDVIKGYEEDDHAYGWAITMDGGIVGIIDAYDYDEHLRTAELGISIAKDHWGEGLGTEALTALLEYLKSEEDLDAVFAWCAADNIGSKTIMEKSGMTLARVDKDAIEVGDRTFDRLYYSYNF